MDKKLGKGGRHTREKNPSLSLRPTSRHEESPTNTPSWDPKTHATGINGPTRDTPPPYTHPTPTLGPYEQFFLSGFSSFDLDHANEVDEKGGSGYDIPNGIRCPTLNTLDHTQIRRLSWSLLDFLRGKGVCLMDINLYGRDGDHGPRGAIDPPRGPDRTLSDREPLARLLPPSRSHGREMTMQLRFVGPYATLCVLHDGSEGV